MKAPFVLLLAVLCTSSYAQIVSYKSTWKYLDNGSNQGSAWRATSFNDGAWKTGAAEFGYGDGDEGTIVLYGTNAKKKFITTYFRKAINFDPSGYQDFTLSLKRDDGAVVYINGIEVFRSNMPTGAIGYTTKASSEPADDGKTAQTATLPKTAFVNGNNVIAVELHQFSANGADISFDLQLSGNVIANLPPIANAGIDQAITLPASSVTLNGSGTDADGTIVSYAWTKLSGPAAGTISSPSTSSTTVTGLTISGTYVFRLTVTDNSGAMATDDVSIVVNSAPVSNPMIPYGSYWNYLDDGTDQGTAWRAASFNDAAWKNGKAQLGYGDGDEVTVVSFGPNSASKYITTYFRKSVNFDPSQYLLYTMKMKRDDGIVIYVNGSEVYRNTMPTGTITYSTLASAAVSDDGTAEITTSVPASAFVNGNNLVAVEIHQNAVSSSDISFDLELSGSNTASITRGPYIQNTTANAVTLRWRTNIATDTKAEVGTSFGTYTISATNPIATTEHEIRLTGLAADTRYYYRIGSASAVIEGTAQNFFFTQPPLTTTRKIRVAAFGDCGTNANNNQVGSLNAYRNYVGSNAAELMLLLGDNAYQNGTDAEYQTGFFDAYSSNILKNHNLFPAPGNHDYANNSTRQNDHNVPYYNIFTVPVNGEGGGVPSGTEAFYSFNWGNIHFLSLDSYGKETNTYRLYDTLGPQATWVKADLDANRSKWIVAYWHHPPYTMGSHNSDTESELVNMRQNFIRILERYGVDLILCGHSHNYERSYLLKGYFGNEASFVPATHAVSNSSAKYDGSSNSCPYTTTTTDPLHGTVYVVSGSAGATGTMQASFPHSALPFALNDGGMFYFEVEDNRLDGKFIRKDGTVWDQFTIMKDVKKVVDQIVFAGQEVTLTASWAGNYNWSNGASTRSITISPLANTTYTVTDPQSCITDQFNITVTGTIAGPVFAETNTRLKIYPVPVRRGENLYINSSLQLKSEIELYTLSGAMIRKIRSNSRTVLNTADLVPGVYMLRYNENGRIVTRRFMVSE